VQVINSDTGKVMDVLVGTPSPAVGEVNRMFGRMWEVVRVIKAPNEIVNMGIVNMDVVDLKEVTEIRKGI